jgi:hypothetical protein
MVDMNLRGQSWIDALGLVIRSIEFAELFCGDFATSSFRNSLIADRDHPFLGTKQQ